MIHIIIFINRRYIHYTILKLSREIIGLNRHTIGIPEIGSIFQISVTKYYYIYNTILWLNRHTIGIPEIGSIFQKSVTKYYYIIQYYG